MKIIGLAGLAGSGKSTVAWRLEQKHHFKRIRFAGPLKAMLSAFGLSDAEIDGDLKEWPCPALGGLTPRYAMQTLGTEWGRDLMGANLWRDAWRRNMREAFAKGERKIVVDDVRFENEAEEIEAMGGRVYRVTRPGVERASAHASENLVLPNAGIIENAGSIWDLNARVDELVTK